MTTITEIIAVGKIAYEHHYNQTMTSLETSHLEAEPPRALVTLAEKNATVVTFGDGSNGIEIDGKTWAHPMAKDCPEYGVSNPLNQEVWHYIGLALSVLGKEENLCNARRAA